MRAENSGALQFYNLEYLRRHVKTKNIGKVDLNGKYIHVTIHYFLVNNYEELCSDFEMEQ